MAFQDEACGWLSRVHLGRVRLPVLMGVVGVALLAVIVVGFGVSRALATDGFVVTKNEEALAVVSESQQDATTAQEEPPARLCVFVSGEVLHPAVYYLDEGARVADAVTAAGGFTPEAATDALNLARTLVDGEQVAVPSQQTIENVSAAPTAGTATSGGNAVIEGASSVAARVNINTADAATLQTLNGIGEATAKKIVADREANGPYKTIEDLKRVSGIGDKKFESLRDSICI